MRLWIFETSTSSRRNQWRSPARESERERGGLVYIFRERKSGSAMGSGLKERRTRPRVSSEANGSGNNPPSYPVFEPYDCLEIRVCADLGIIEDVVGCWIGGELGFQSGFCTAGVFYFFVSWCGWNDGFALGVNGRMRFWGWCFCLLMLDVWLPRDWTEADLDEHGWIVIELGLKVPFFTSAGNVCLNWNY